MDVPALVRNLVYPPCCMNALRKRYEKDTQYTMVTFSAVLSSTANWRGLSTRFGAH